MNAAEARKLSESLSAKKASVDNTFRIYKWIEEAIRTLDGATEIVVAAALMTPVTRAKLVADGYEVRLHTSYYTKTKSPWMGGSFARPYADGEEGDYQGWEGTRDYLISWN